ncbi:MAG TPA: ribonuclease R, partial [Parachlamydiaceae bacterium]|nr:ribonuclease R [Parachlamydiaceae bacterium]
DLMLESFLHISELEDDYYVYDEEAQKLNGKRSGSSFFSGDKITVSLSDVDLITRESRWHLVSREIKDIERSFSAGKKRKTKVKIQDKKKKPKSSKKPFKKSKK